MAVPFELGGSRWLVFLQRELAPFPGRFNPVLRTLLSSFLVIVISMTLQIPFLALSLIMVFFITQANAAISKMVGTLFLLGVPVSTAAGAVLLKFTFDYPLLRLVTASVVFLVCMFLLRTSRFSLFFFVNGFVLIYVQSLVDIVPDPEALLRTNLWVGAATLYSIVISLLVNTFFFPVEPSEQFSTYLQGLIALIQGRLSSYAAQKPVDPLAPEALQRSVLTLQRLLRFSAMRSREYAKYEDYYTAIVIGVSRLLRASSSLSHSTAEPVQDVTGLLGASTELAVAFRSRQPFRFSGVGNALRGAPALLEMENAFQSIDESHGHPSRANVSSRPPFFAAPDAFSNPRYLKFALKAYMATMLCYVFYNSVDWPGIHTIMLTCVITALPNIGASAQKGILRIDGCLIGAALSFGAMIFVFPYLDTIVGMLLVSLTVVALSAWICAGSEKVSYAGTQIVFCFALALLEDFGPVYDLTVIRDRVIGIVLGVAVTTAIQVLIWPESERLTLVGKLQKMLDEIADGLTPATNSPPREFSMITGWNEVADCEAMLTRVQLETAAKLSNPERYSDWANTTLSACRALLLAGAEIRMNHLSKDLSVMAVTLIDCQQELADELAKYSATIRPDSLDVSLGSGLEALEKRVGDISDAALSQQQSLLRRQLRQVIEIMQTLPASQGWR